MAGEHIDEAFVDIKPDVSDFDRDLNRELTSSLKSVERKLDGVVESIEKGFDDLIKDLSVHFEHLVTVVDDSFDSVKKDAEQTGRAIATDIEAGTKVAKNAIDDLADDADRDFRRMRRDADRGGGDVGHSFIRSFFNAIKDLGSSATSAIGGALGNIGGALGSVFGGGGDIVGAIKVGLIATAIPVVIGLAGALSQLIGLLALLPGIAAGAIAAIAPLVIAFQGFGEAIGAGFSGDMEKFNEALKELAPSARAVVREFVAFRDPLKQLRRDVQQAFFAELVGQIKPLLSDIIPVLGRGLVQVAAALSRFAAGFVQLLRSAPVLDTIRELFASVGRSIDTVAPAVIFFIETMFGLIRASLPWLERFADQFAIALTRFSDFLQNATNTGQFNTWIENGVRVLGELWDLLKAVGGLLKTLFAGTAESGETFIVSLTEMINKLNNFFSNTQEGKEFLITLSATIKFAAAAILGFGIAVANIIRWMNQFVHWLIDAWNWIKQVGSAIGGFFSSIGSAIASAFTAVVNWISNAWNTVTNFFSALPGRIMATLSALPGILRTAAVNAFDQFFYAVGFGIARVIKFFMDLPEQVWAQLRALWDGAVSIVSSGVNAVSNFFGALPGRVAGFISALKLRAALLITETKNTFVARVRELVDESVNTARNLPGRVIGAIGNLVSRFFNLGQDIIQGMINGIGSMVSSLVNAAKRAASKAWEGAKDALGIGSPSKEFAKLGKWSMQGFNEGFKDEGEDSRRRGDDPGTGLMPYDVFGPRGPRETKTMASGGGGGTTLIAYLQISDDQLKPVVVRSIEENPQTVATASEHGERQLSRRR
jgi:phage-related protein